jgi:hypothetical protein
MMLECWRLLGKEMESRGDNAIAIFILCVLLVLRYSSDRNGKTVQFADLMVAINFASRDSGQFSS